MSNNNKMKAKIEEAMRAEVDWQPLHPGCDVLIIDGKAVPAVMTQLFADMTSAYHAEAEAQAAEVAGVPEGFTRNEKGHLIPNVQIEDKRLLENALINESHCLMAAMSAGADMIRMHIHSEADALCSMRIIDAGGSELLPQEPGKVSLRNMDGTRQVQIDRRATMSLSPEAAVAQEMVMACVERRSKDVDKLLLSMVDAAWKTNADGDLSVSKVSALFSLPCRDADWLEAMDAIRASMRGTGIKTYTRLYSRPTANDKWVLIEAKV